MEPDARTPSAGRRAFLVVLASSVLLAPALGALQQREEDEVEDFEEIDPYTKGDPALLARLGYVSYGPFLVFAGEMTDHVAESLGGIELLWVETASFKIGSNLPTYRMSGDQDERDLLARELDRLRKRLGKLKAPKRELDPWLRLHLYAQRMEELHEDFCRRFELSPASFGEETPYLGQPEKLVVLLLDTKSSLERFCGHYSKTPGEFSSRFHVDGRGHALALSAEAYESIGQDLDIALHCSLASLLAQSFLETYRGGLHRCPAWWQFGLAHSYARRVDPRFVPATGYGQDRLLPEGHEEWEARVASLVQNESFAPTEEMLGWSAYEELDVRDHMVAWSRVEYLLGLPEGDRRGFLDALRLPLAPSGSEPSAAQDVELQARALETCFRLSPALLDEAWSRHVLRTYR